jgi:hypothetical protein
MRATRSFDESTCRSMSTFHSADAGSHTIYIIAEQPVDPPRSPAGSLLRQPRPVHPWPEFNLRPRRIPDATGGSCVPQTQQHRAKAETTPWRSRTGSGCTGQVLPTRLELIGPLLGPGPADHVDSCGWSREPGVPGVPDVPCGQRASYAFRAELLRTEGGTVDQLVRQLCAFHAAYVQLHQDRFNEFGRTRSSSATTFNLSPRRGVHPHRLCCQAIPLSARPARERTSADPLHRQAQPNASIMPNRRSAATRTAEQRGG